jgi:hypothetical protein
MVKELGQVATNLLTLGGFIYHEGEYFIKPKEHEEPPVVEQRNYNFRNGKWQAPGKPDFFNGKHNMVRITSQIRVVNAPHKALPNQGLPLGHAVGIPADVQKTLQEWKDKLADEPFWMDEVTIPALLEMGRENFKWLNPGHELIKKIKAHNYEICADFEERNQYAPEGGYAALGAYIYYSSDPAKSKLVPVVSIEEGVRHLKGKYFSCLVNPSGEAEADVIGDNLCVICYTNPQTIKFNNCEHPPKKGENGVVTQEPKGVICADCLPKLRQVKCECPVCRASFTNTTVVQPNNLDVMKTLREKRPTMDFKLTQLHINGEIDDWLTQGLMLNPAFTSKKCKVTEGMIKKFNLPDEAKGWEVAFVDPVTGKSLHLAHAEVNMAKEIVSCLNNTDGAEKEASAMSGLFSIGGFVFSHKGKVKSAFAFVNEKDEVSNPISLKAVFDQDQTKKDQLLAAHKQMVKTQKEDDLEAEHQPDICRITLVGLFDELKSAAPDYFQFEGDRFGYLRSEDNSYFCYKLPELN